MKLRDVIALPFLFLGQLFEYLGVVIGGEWIARMVYEIEKNKAINLLKETTKESK